jgi:hypothetical protein
MRQNSDKPPRTLGIALAIVLASLFYTVIPLGFVGFTYALQAQMRDTGIAVGIGDVEIPGGSVGFASISRVELILWTITAIAFLIVAILAWRGQGTQIRFVFLGAVIVAPLAYWGLWAFRSYRDQQYLAETGAIIAGTGLPGICSSAFALPILVTLYIMWYMNRGPARAFYRGYYLERNDDQLN